MAKFVVEVHFICTMLFDLRLSDIDAPIPTNSKLECLNANFPWFVKIIAKSGIVYD